MLRNAKGQFARRGTTGEHIADCVAEGRLDELIAYEQLDRAVSGGFVTVEQLKQAEIEYGEGYERPCCRE